MKEVGYKIGKYFVLFSVKRNDGNFFLLFFGKN